MATVNNADKINRLQVYVDMLKARLAGGVPEKHKDAPEGFKMMIEIDLKKSQANLDKLKGI